MFTIFRTKKLKSWSVIAAAGAHNYRVAETPNSNGKKNIVISGSENTEELVKNKIGEQKIRKNAVLAVECILTASPDFFLDKSKFKKWREAAEKFIAAEFPHAISVVLHLDETSPHYHVLDVPLDDRGRLNARAKYGGRECMRSWQDRAAAPFAELGLNRGVRGSKAKHQAVKRYYSMVSRPVKVPRLPAELPAPTFLEKMPFTEARKNRKENEKKYEIKLEKVTRKIVDEYGSIIRKAAEYEKMKKENEQLKQQLVEKDKQLQERKALADKLRALPLVEVLTKMYKAEETKDSSESYKSRKFKLFNDQLEIAITDDLWVKQGGKGGKNAINLVMELEQCSFNEALKLMSEYFSRDALAAEYNRAAVEKTAKTIEKTIRETEVHIPKRSDKNLQYVRKYLSDRGIPKKLIAEMIDQGKIYADSLKNAVFVRTKGGAFLRGTIGQKFHRTIGGKDAGSFFISGDSRDLYLCESPIDALAIKSARPTANVLALGGNLLKIADIKAAVTRRFDRFFAAFDSDKAGRRMTGDAELLLGAEPALPPTAGAKDWAEALHKDSSLIDPIYRDDSEAAAQKPAEPLLSKPAAAQQRRILMSDQAAQKPGGGPRI